MAVRNRLWEERYLVDWNGNGLYDHNLSDVSLYTLNCNYEYGMNAQADKRGPTWGLSKGRIDINNIRGIFSVDVAGGVQDRLLTRPHKFKHLINDELQFEAILQPLESTARSADGVVQGQITSELKPIMTEKVGVYTPGRGELINVETVNDIVFDQLGIAHGDHVYNDWKLARGIQYGCAFNQYLSHMEKYSDSYLIETRDGSLRWISPHVRPEPVRNIQDRFVEVERSTAWIDRRVQLTRNRAQVRYLLPNTTPKNVQIASGVAYIPTDADESEPLIFTGEDFEYSGVAGFVDTLHRIGLDLQQPPTAKRHARIIIDNVLENTIAFRAVRIPQLGRPDKPDLSFDFRIEGFVTNLDKIVERNINDLPAQEDYAEQPYEGLPAWYSYEDDTAQVESLWRRRLPYRIGTMVLPVYQNEPIYDLHAGDVIHATATQRGITYSGDFMIARKYYRRQARNQNSPRIRWHLIEIPRIPQIDYNATVRASRDERGAAVTGYMRLHDPEPEPIVERGLTWRGNQLIWRGFELTWR